MSDSPEPLSEGAVLDERFELGRVLGRGGFSIAYLASDLERRDACVVKELAPAGTLRADEGGMLRWPGEGPGAVQRLRQRFLEEARLLSRLTLPGVLPVRSAFQQNGTAYFAGEHLPGAKTLERIIQQEGRLDSAGAMDILLQLAETLNGLHQAGILHRDIKPSNVLIDPKGAAYLIDFGAAREWHADADSRQTVLFTPGYAPLEQLSEKAQRGPATDVYALCATAFHMLVGEPPPPATDRAAGTALPSIQRLRPDVEPRVAEAVRAGLALRYVDRPPTMVEFLSLVSEPADRAVPADPLGEFDDRALRLQRFSAGKRQCPNCGGLLDSPRPLRRGVCPVCREGTVRLRPLSEKVCPICRSGVLARRSNAKTLLICPLCRIGLLDKSRKGLFSRECRLDCVSCGASYQATGSQIELAHAGKAAGPPVGTKQSADLWRRDSGRAEEVLLCDGCGAQLDVAPDGRWVLVSPKGKQKWQSLYPDEWARVAANLEPGAGNAECESCAADYFVESDRITLLGAHRDPHGFAHRHAGRLLTASEVQWLAVGKRSPRPGLVCSSCGTELDQLPTGLGLISTPTPRLAQHVGEVLDLANWCRIGQDLPTEAQESAFQLAFDEAVLNAYEDGRVPFDGGAKSGEMWRSRATRLAWDAGEWIEAGEGNLTIGPSEIVFGGLIRKARTPLRDVRRVWAEGDRLVIETADGARTAFEVPTVELTVALKSGRRTARLNAECLARRVGRATGAKP